MAFYEHSSDSAIVFRMIVGYSGLIEQYQLRCLPPLRTSEISKAAKGRQLVSDTGFSQHYRFEPRYAPGSSLPEQLEFALKYEGVNLEVLKALFLKVGPKPIEDWLTATPNSSYARRAGYLYEWLLNKELAVKTTTTVSYVDVLSAEDYVVALHPEKSSRFNVNNNLLGTPAFCPLVRRTDITQRYASSKIADRVRSLIESTSKRVIERAVAFLYLAETQFSFGIEREKPSPEKAKRFADLLGRTSSIKAINADVLVEVQNLVVQERSREPFYRSKQNWIGDSLGEHRKRVNYVPPKPGDVPDMMDGLLKYIENSLPGTSDIVGAAAAAAFGFVYIHPFLDGNGRIHRFLIHYMLENGGFTPKNTIIPVSAAIYADIEKYLDVLDSIARPILQHVKYRWTDGSDDLDVKGNDVDFYRYFDATTHYAYLYEMIEKAATETLPQEIEFVIAFDQARQQINSFLDIPGKDLNLLLQVTIANDGKLSTRKRHDLFPNLTDEEVQRIETALRDSFPHGFKQFAQLQQTSKKVRTS